MKNEDSSFGNFDENQFLKEQQQQEEILQKRQELDVYRKQLEAEEMERQGIQPEQPVTPEGEEPQQEQPQQQEEVNNLQELATVPVDAVGAIAQDIVRFGGAEPDWMGIEDGVPELKTKWGQTLLTSLSFSSRRCSLVSLKARL